MQGRRLRLVCLHIIRLAHSSVTRWRATGGDGIDRATVSPASLSLENPATGEAHLIGVVFGIDCVYDDLIVEENPMERSD